MINVTEEIYRQLAENLISEIKELNSDYFNGCIELDTEEYYSELKCSLIIFRETSGEKSCHQGSCSEGSYITNIIPVWWEFSIYTSQGEQNNNFSWSEFINYTTPHTLC